MQSKVLYETPETSLQLTKPAKKAQHAAPTSMPWLPPSWPWAPGLVG